MWFWEYVLYMYGQRYVLGQKVCPSGDLEPAYMNRNDQLLAYNATAASTTFATVTQTSAAETAGATDTSNTAQEKDDTPVAAIAGGVAGGVFALTAIAGFLIYYCCFIKKSRKARAERQTAEEQTNKEMQLRLQQHRDAPPDYTSPSHIPAPFHHSTDNSNSNNNNTYYAYTHPHEDQPPSPQELPIHSPNPNKSSPTHTRGPSELSADNTLSELETPDTTPKHHPGEFKQIPSAFVQTPPTEYTEEALHVRNGARGRGRRSRFVEMSPMGGVANGARDARSTDPVVARSAWVAPQDWGFYPPAVAEGGLRSQRGSRKGRGLGVDGVDDIMARMGRLERLDDQRAVRGGSKPCREDVGDT
ncbi:predicted protein [Plenodomus lingam JN3]|uniref:Predicted protein n=1 Tax=Leptosphaeria maculans (strain JN3 / isolate v23.1.3 / race Av1-4-5-6-7-8) TaxID=985895 RepID=E4ZUG5_LEPMJ|nr:predicted protein [Plenodomus lingam JN3]CBX95044.1 predicted protein [Plenodomus lingam JN3]